MKEQSAKQGFYGWWLLPILCLDYSIPIGFALYGPPVIYQFMQKELRWQRGEINLGYSIIGVMLGLGALVIPWMINRFGLRKTLTIGAVLAAISSVLMAAFGHLYPIYLFLCFFLGLGISFGSVVPIQTLVVLWFNVRRALAMGLVLGGGAIGGFIYPQIISACIVNLGGDWRLGWDVIALACFLGSIIALLAVRNRPEDLGQHPDGISSEEVRPIVPHSRQKPIKTYRSPINWKLRDALKTPALWSIILGPGFIYFLWQTILTQTPAHLSDRGFSPSDPVIFYQPAFIYGLILAFSIVGRLSVSLLGDVIQTRFLTGIAGFCIVIGGILFWFASRENLWAVYLYPLLAGFGFGATYVSVPLILGNYFGAGSFHNISGISNPTSSLIQFAGPFAAGSLYDINGNYGLAIILACSCAFIGSLIVLFCSPPRPHLCTSS
jgi:MFS family permease